MISLGRRVGDSCQLYNATQGYSIDVELTISGFNGSTNVVSLAQAFEGLAINVTLPALKTNLLQSAALKGIYQPGHVWDVI